VGVRWQEVNDLFLAEALAIVAGPGPAVAIHAKGIYLEQQAPATELVHLFWPLDEDRVALQMGQHQDESGRWQLRQGVSGVVGQLALGSSTKVWTPRSARVKTRSAFR
jgi:hypothetical protein